MKIDLNANLQVRSCGTKPNSWGKAPCVCEQLYTEVRAWTTSKGRILHAPVGFPATGRTILARCERPFSEDPLENVLSGLAWEHILYQDGPVGGELSSSPAIS